MELISGKFSFILKDMAEISSQNAAPKYKIETFVSKVLGRMVELHSLQLLRTDNKKNK